jgi:hypothetical protein
MAHKRYETFGEWLVLDKKTGCLNFSGGKVGIGYGRLRIGRRQHLAHRHAYELKFGPIPDGLLVCHTCDNPACCNTDHLFLGSQTDNMSDRMKKGRYGTAARGAKNGSAKLTDAEVTEIRSLISSGMRQVDIAARFGITQPLVSQIALRKKWQHLP